MVPIHLHQVFDQSPRNQIPAHRIVLKRIMLPINIEGWFDVLIAMLNGPKLNER